MEMNILTAFLYSKDILSEIERYTIFLFFYIEYIIILIFIIIDYYSKLVLVR